MKKVLAFGLVLLLLTLLLPGVAFAGDDGKGDNDQPKTGYRGENSCGIYTGPEFGGGVIAESWWAAYGANENYFLKCIGHLAEGIDPPAKPVVFWGLWCSTPAGPTPISKTVIDTNGEVRLVCKVLP